MPYYVYKLIKSSTGATKSMGLLDQFDAFKDAKTFARKLRAEGTDNRTVIKVMFADCEADAEQQLTVIREAPILKEWEK